MYTKEEIAQELKKAVEWLIDQDEGCVTIKLDDRLGICVGWLPGYGEEKRDDCIQSKEEPDFAINAGIKVYTSDDMRTDYEFINMPYYENGDVLATDVSVEADDDYMELAEYLLDEYEGMKDLDIDENGLIIVEDEHEVEVPSGGTEHRELSSDYTHEDESLKEDWEKEFKEIESKYIGKECEFTHLDEYDEEEQPGLKEKEGEHCTITSANILDDYDEDGFDSCYWNIKFGDDKEFIGVPGVALRLFEEESLKEGLSSVSQEELNKLSNELDEHFAELGAYYDIWWDDDGICVEISWGDWKHDHLWCDYEVENFLKSKGHEVVSHDTEVTEENGSDTYSAIHSYIIK